MFPLTLFPFTLCRPVRAADVIASDRRERGNLKTLKTEIASSLSLLVMTGQGPVPFSRWRFLPTNHY
jgi:hypothetical protein